MSNPQMNVEDLLETSQQTRRRLTDSTTVDELNSINYAMRTATLAMVAKNGYASMKVKHGANMPTNDFFEPRPKADTAKVAAPAANEPKLKAAR